MKIENADVDGVMDDVPRPDSAEGAQSVDIDVKSESDETATVRIILMPYIVFPWNSVYDRFLLRCGCVV